MSQNIDTEKAADASYLREHARFLKELRRERSVLTSWAISLLMMFAFGLVTFLYMTDAGFIEPAPIDIGYIDANAGAGAETVDDVSAATVSTGQPANLQGLLIVIVPIFLAAGAR